LELSSPRFKGLAVSAGLSFWFFIIVSSLGMFSFEIFAVFVGVIIIITQIFAMKLAKVLDVFAIFNTKIFLGLLFIFVISLYGILFKVLRIDLLRTKKQEKSYWLEIEQLKESRIFKQY
jgi:hypothetical protein